MGKTPSGKTGPETDHTTLRFGEFMASTLTYKHCRMLVNVPKDQMNM